MAFDATGTRLVTCEVDKAIKMCKKDENATPQTHLINFKPPKNVRRIQMPFECWSGSTKTLVCGDVPCRGGLFKVTSMGYFVLTISQGFVDVELH